MAPIVVMGVSGSGNSTIGASLAERLADALVDADSPHPEGNVDTMAAGLCLDHDDRRPWLHAVATELAGGEVVVA